MTSRLRYCFKFQWRKPGRVPIAGDFAFRMEELQDDGAVITTFVGAGWVYVLVALFFLAGLLL